VVGQIVVVPRALATTARALLDGIVEAGGGVVVMG
jgi:hypothetical protein